MCERVCVVVLVAVVVVMVVQQQQYVGSKKPATDGRSDETELEFPLAFMGFVSRELVLPRRCLQMSRRQLAGSIARIIREARGRDNGSCRVLFICCMGRLY